MCIQTDLSIDRRLAAVLPDYEAQNQRVPVALRVQGRFLDAVKNDIHALRGFGAVDADIRGGRVHAELPAPLVRMMHMDVRVERVIYTPN